MRYIAAYFLVIAGLIACSQDLAKPSKRLEPPRPLAQSVIVGSGPELHLVGPAVRRFPTPRESDERARYVVQGTLIDGGCQYQWRGHALPRPDGQRWMAWEAEQDYDACTEIVAEGPYYVERDPNAHLLELPRNGQLPKGFLVDSAQATRGIARPSPLGTRP